MTRILVVEDDPAILRVVADNLRFEGYEVVTGQDGEAGARLQRQHRPDLIVLDLMMPHLGGLELCRMLRGEGVGTPILMLTAKSAEADRVTGLDLGADDYMTKPFSVKELLARVRALLRRVHPQQNLPGSLRFGEVEVDFRRYEARRSGKPIEMTRKEFATLRFLAARAGEVVTRDELLNEVWGYGAYPVTRTVDNHVAGLRAKLEADPSAPSYIRTVHGVGYKFTADEIS